MLRKIIRKLDRIANPPEEVTASDRVELFYWKPAKGNNFGDDLSSVVVTKVAADRGYFLNEQVGRRARMLAIGSILHFAKDGDVVWGSGVNGKIEPNRHAFSKIDVRAVRGPLTRDFLRKRGIDVPEIYGDPALLLPHILPSLTPDAKRRPYVVVPNLHDEATLAGTANMVSPLLPWRRCVTEILSADFVIATSLHGVIVAEAFGIPCRYLRISQNESPFKYDDYAMGTGRSGLPHASSVAEALEMGPMAPIQYDARPLLSAFPVDLWQPSDAGA